MKITNEAYDIKVLVVDDDLTNIEVAKEMLILLGCKVHIALNAKEAIELSEENVYSLIFMDIAMPEADGFEATRKIREKDTATIIIGLSANIDSREVINKCLEAGMNDCIAKPLTISTLITRFNALGLKKKFKHG